MHYAIKVEIIKAKSKTFVFDSQKTMYGGRYVVQGDEIYIFASENEGGKGLFAKGTVTESLPVPLKPGLQRQTPRLSIKVKVTAWAKRPLGRRDLKSFSVWDDGKPQTELNFKFYRQSTNKIVGISNSVTRYLNRFF